MTKSILMWTDYALIHFGMSFQTALLLVSKVTARLPYCNQAMFYADFMLYLFLCDDLKVAVTSLLSFFYIVITNRQTLHG